jgi:undecaprenyl-phosphate 4-deoxy-4-formamido-L-arabinose transferase
MNLSCSIVIPVYNSAAILPTLIERIAQARAQIADACEVILVNDGSRDASWQIICEQAQKYPWVRGLNLLRNFGQHNALLAGIRTARFEIIVTMDDDLQHPPEEIPKLIAKLNEGYDLVYGTPELARHDFWRVLASGLTRIVLRGVLPPQISDTGSSFRAFRAYLREVFAQYASPFVTIDVLLAWGTRRLASVRVHHATRLKGKSTYSFLKLLVLAADVTTGFSTWPLRLASLIGFAFTLVGVGVFLYTLILYLIEGGSVPSLRFIGSIVAFFAGAQLFALGIIGEYLARIHLRMMGRPAYIVREQTNLPSEGDPNV